jgi:hypothetical protein
MKVCLKCIQISIIHQTAQIMEKPHLDANVAYNLIVDTQMCPFALSIVSVAMPILTKYVRFQLKTLLYYSTLLHIVHELVLL